jgi:hypothetical protein
MRNLTKESREKSREAQFNSLLTNGYLKTEYKNLVVFYHPQNLLLKSFWGTAANHTDFFKYRSAEQLMQKVEDLKATADKREEWKAKQKEENKGKSSSHAATAAAIKTELKSVYPYIKFSVKSETFAGGNSVHISWTEGPTTEEVEKYTSKYQYGHFDGMSDMYEYSNHIEGLPQTKYVSTSRNSKDDNLKLIESQMLDLMTFDSTNYHNEPQQIAYRVFNKTSFPQNYTSFKVVRSDVNSGSGYESFFKIVFEVPEVEEIKSTTIHTEETDNKIKFIDYSDKAFAVIGNFGDLYEGLINIGGKYNKFLKCGKGIIFPKSKIEAVKTYLIAQKENKGVTPQQVEEIPTESEEISENEQNNTLKDEVSKTIDFFIETDLKLYGEVTEGTIKAAEVQKVDIFEKLEDIEQAAKSGQIISLCNLSNLVNQKNNIQPSLF